MSNPHDYTVGWICAMPTEYVAAQAFLDEEHEGPRYVSPHDNNHYTLGKIGRHSIVIAALPNSEYGISSAAIVARDMINSFPNIRFGLMVGTGGGAPSLKHDIRLGDVVVGIHYSEKGGVVQYDFNKAVQGQGFQITGFLNQPPAVLRTAVAGLMSQHELNGTLIKETINSILAKRLRLRKQYKRPKATTDRLYRSQVTHHLNGGTVCAVVCGDDPSNFFQRPERDEDNDPTIHYGLIASANKLMNDALVRDELTANEGILCFETGAAGLMNHFPCLVIRGICDYSDSHQNKEWQGYAAMTAAAYAKELLYQLAPIKFEAEKMMNNILSDLEILTRHRDIARNHREIAEDHSSIETYTRNVAKELSKEARECHQLFRLTASKKDSTYEWYKDRVEERAEDTCLWFLKHEHFQAWLNQESGPLLVSADPGCGKSVLAKYLINHILPQSATVCYFFFKDQDQNTVRQALCAILHQLFSQKPSLIEHAMPKFRIDGLDLINSTESLWEILQNAIKDPKAGPITIILDALDECAESELAGLMQKMESQFHKDQLNDSKLKYLLTCRPYEQITLQFHGLFNSFPNIRIPGEEESEAISRDINYVITHRLNQLSAKKKLSSDSKDYLKTRLQKTSHRTYLWVYLIFNYLETENFKRTPKGIESIINILPQSINEAYEQILNKSKQDKRVRKALSIILAASRPLTLSEMNIAMNIDNTLQSINNLDLKNQEDFKMRLRSLCGLFVSIYHNKIYFLHQTAREFLLADLASPTAIPSVLHWHHSITIQGAHAVLAELCVRYLSFFNSEVILPTDANRDAGHSVNSHAFLDYSAKSWGIHFREASIMDDNDIVPLALGICNPDSKSYSVWFTIYWKTTHTRTTEYFTDLMVASYFGHRAVVNLLLAKGADIETKDSGHGRTPLSWAAGNGHEAVAKLLLEKGADIETKDSGHGRTPLSLAAGNGHEAVAKLLLKNGADFESTNDFGRTPLLFAAERGHNAVAHVLIEWGADVNVIAGGVCALSSATKDRNEDILELLLSSEANVEMALQSLNSVDDQMFLKQSALHYAAAAGNQNMVKILISAGVDVNHASKPDLKVPLHLAVESGRLDVVTALLDANADPTREDELSRTPIYYANRIGSTSILQALEAAIDDYNKDFDLGLCYIANSGRFAVHTLPISKRMNDYTLFSDILDAYKQKRCKGLRRYSLKGLQGVKTVEYIRMRPESDEETIPYDYMPESKLLATPAGLSHLCSFIKNPPERSKDQSEWVKVFFIEFSSRPCSKSGFGLRYVEGWIIQRITVLAVTCGVGALLIGILWATILNRTSDGFAITGCLIAAEALVISLVVFEAQIRPAN